MACNILTFPLPIFQWDSNIALDVNASIISEDGHQYVHYQHKGQTEVYSIEVTDGKAAIPNIILQTAGAFEAYAYIADDAHGKTLVRTEFTILPRPLPPEYIYDPTPVITYPELVDLVDDLTALRDALSNVSASAETLPAGSAASAEATLSPDGLAFVFGIPQGEQGERGEQGEQGEQGERGEQGIPGKDGKDAVVDPTLSHAGEAADAKATGDALAGKVDEVAGKGLSTNDYTNTDKNKVDHISIEADHGSAYNKVIIQTDKPETERVFFELRTNDGYESDIYAEFGTIVDDEEEIQPLLIKGVATPTASNDAANKGYVDSALADKMDKANPTGTGALSINRRASTVGNYSVAIGYDNLASGSQAIALGLSNGVTGNWGVAIGNGNTATAISATAIGSGCTAGNPYSFVIGHGSRGGAQDQFVAGCYNVQKSAGLRVSGNGTSNSARSNAEYLDKSGNLKLAGDVYVGCAADSTGGNKVATESYVDGLVGNVAALLADLHNGGN